MKRIHKRCQEIVKKNNKEKWSRELDFWKKNFPIYFRSVKYDSDVIEMTYCEFKNLVKAGKGLI